jgi:hypothetical protein
MSIGRIVPELFTELIGAELIPSGVTAKGGQAFTFGGALCWTHKNHYKIEDGRFYSSRWMAKENAGKWKGKFINNWTQMEAVDFGVLDRVSSAAAMIKEGNALIAQGSMMVQQGLKVLED